MLCPSLPIVAAASVKGFSTSWVVAIAGKVDGGEEVVQTTCAASPDLCAVSSNGRLAHATMMLTLWLQYYSGVPVAPAPE